LWLIAALGLGGIGFLAVAALVVYLLVRSGMPTRAAATATPLKAVQVATTAAPTEAEVLVEPSQTPSVTASLAPSATLTPMPATLTATIQPSSSPVPATATLPPLGRGGLIAFVSDRADGKTLQIWTMRASMNDQGQMVTGDLKQLTSSEGNKRQPRWSPDGSELLFVAPGGGPGELDIWKMKADGSSAPVDISNRKGSETDPAWSPDGKQIAFTVDSRGDGVLQLYIMNADGSNPYKLSYDQDESSPAWSPRMDWLGFVMNIAGNRIFYLRAPSNPAAATPAPPFYVTPQPFDQFDLRGNLGQVAEPVWSPDGNWIAYTSLRNNNERLQVARYPIKVVDQDIIPLATSGRNMSPAWSPDSQWIVFVSYRDGNPELYVMRSTGKNQSRLTDAPGKDLDPSWQTIPSP
jgi:TolB protein